MSEPGGGASAAGLLLSNNLHGYPDIRARPGLLHRKAGDISESLQRVHRVNPAATVVVAPYPQGAIDPHNYTNPPDRTRTFHLRLRKASRIAENPKGVNGIDRARAVNVTPSRGRAPAERVRRRSDHGAEANYCEA